MLCQKVRVKDGGFGKRVAMASRDTLFHYQAPFKKKKKKVPEGGNNTRLPDEVGGRNSFQGPKDPTPCP